MSRGDFLSRETRRFISRVSVAATKTHGRRRRSYVCSRVTHLWSCKIDGTAEYLRATVALPEAGDGV